MSLYCCVTLSFDCCETVDPLGNNHWSCNKSFALDDTSLVVHSNGSPTKTVCGVGVKEMLTPVWNRGNTIHFDECMLLYDGI